LQWFLRRQIKLGEQRPYRSKAEADTELLLDQVRHHRARPETKVQTVLAWMQSSERDIPILGDYTCTDGLKPKFRNCVIAIEKVGDAG
jgi:hypothetical protein